MDTLLGESQKKAFPGAPEHWFYELLFKRIDEHFAVADDRIAIRPSEELRSGCLRSPDDEDATYRKKRGVGYRGEILTATETCNPENGLQLITDVQVTANNRDDSDEPCRA